MGFDIGGCLMSFKNNNLCFENSFHTWQMYVQGSRGGLETWA